MKQEAVGFITMVMVIFSMYAVASFLIALSADYFAKRKRRNENSWRKIDFGE